MKALSALLLVVIAAGSIKSQNASLTFEVASIKLNASRGAPGDRALGCRGTDSHKPDITIPLGRCVARYEPLRLVVALAYGIPPASLAPYEGAVLSGPSWINTEMYNIDAKADAPTTQAQLKLMLQGLLADRFKLKLHKETKEMSVYSLVLGKNGPKLTPAPKDRECAGQVRRDHQYELAESSLTGQCHIFVPGGRDAMITGQSVEMSDLAEMISTWAGRVVVDKTGVMGLYDIKLPRFTSGQLSASLQTDDKNPAGGGREGLPGRNPQAAQELPTLFNVLDQFGLKLESAKGPVEVLVIDSIQKPSEN
jgi:uncharacterized protein (TIGR03435 family)